MGRFRVDIAVARATGEPLSTVQKIGFRLLGEPTTERFRKPVCVIIPRDAHKKRKELK